MKNLTKLFLVLGLTISCSIGTALAEEKKNALIIRVVSTHGKDSYNNDQVEKADLIIISSDGGGKHALMDKKNPTKHMKHLDGFLKKNKTGLIVIHWATDATSEGMEF